MDERTLAESTRQFALCLSELQSRLDPDSYALLLRILKATNDAIVTHSDGIDVLFSEHDQELLAPEFTDSLRRLLSCLGPLGMNLITDIDLPQQPSPSQREQDRREIDGIARVSGMGP
ncbi:hypothetical protein [Streptomyces sp. NPDC001816]|uniref:hypothetical protein n=1 Tax=Streptomyces sp. NPDC001816 TaxID=3364612 RepID=UPI0036ABD2DE